MKLELPDVSRLEMPASSSPNRSRSRRKTAPRISTASCTSRSTSIRRGSIHHLYVYPGPQTESVTKTFNPRSVNISLAQFGFIVVEVGNRGGNPQRSKGTTTTATETSATTGWPTRRWRSNSSRAKTNRLIDINRVGIWGHSGGGFMSAAAMLVYPDFFKVAFSESGNHENNIYNNTWSEKHHGIKEVTDKDGNVKFEYNIETNSELAKNLKGRLMLVHGRHRQQRAPGQYHAPGRCPDQGEQALRHARSARHSSRVRTGERATSTGSPATLCSALARAGRRQAWTSWS